jgi:hypothetical protein
MDPGVCFEQCSVSELILVVEFIFIKNHKTNDIEVIVKDMLIYLFI